MRRFPGTIFFIGCLVIGQIPVREAFGLDSEGLTERDLTVKESVDRSSGQEKSDIGEIEKETEHDVFPDREPRQSQQPEDNGNSGQANHDSGETGPQPSSEGSQAGQGDHP
jgi:hypothetical protein